VKKIIIELCDDILFVVVFTLHKRYTNNPIGKYPLGNHAYDERKHKIENEILIINLVIAHKIVLFYFFFTGKSPRNVLKYTKKFDRNTILIHVASSNTSL
jgi:hypothetical protein